MACQDSHCRALELYLQSEKELDACFICEDDIEFMCTGTQLNSYIEEFIKNPHAEALCLGYSSREHCEYSPLFWKTTDNQTRTAYLIKRSLATDLLDLWRRLYTLRVSGNHTKEPNWYSILFKSLPLQSHPQDIYRGDQCWKILQHTRHFIIPKNPLAKQRPSYSDIECKLVNYLT
jgi:GR25 family glycosyltransferase involved in LPS biosynthesis